MYIHRKMNLKKPESITSKKCMDLEDALWDKTHWGHIEWLMLLPKEDKRKEVPMETLKNDVGSHGNILLLRLVNWPKRPIGQIGLNGQSVQNAQKGEIGQNG